MDSERVKQSNLQDGVREDGIIKVDETEEDENDREKKQAVGKNEVEK